MYEIKIFHQIRCLRNQKIHNKALYILVSYSSYLEFNCDHSQNAHFIFKISNKVLKFSLSNSVTLGLFKLYFIW